MGVVHRLTTKAQNYAIRHKAQQIITHIDGKLEEARQLAKAKPHLEWNLWYWEQLDKLVDLAIECEKIIEETKEV